MPVRITLTTDFGTRDPYVAQVKAVLYAHGPPALEVVDLTHEIGAQDVREAALFVEAAWPRFPPRTIHLVVVDPGVGSGRRALAVRHGTQLWLAPDNGVLSLLLDGSEDAVAIDQARVAAGQVVTATFHGRDLFAPAAAALAHGQALERLGPPARELVRLAFPSSSRSQDGLRGEIIHIDRFGNLISNVTRAELAALGALGRLCVRLQDGKPLSLVSTYADAVSGESVALIGSSQRLEIAVTNGSAQARFGAGLGATVWVGPPV
jgi:S-adenosylmethionine hydrolase